MAGSKNWLEVNREGLAQLFADKPKRFIGYELWQNARDEDVTEVSINVNIEPGRPRGCIIVEDDAPDGFKDLAHAYEMFASSYKKWEPNKAGRFNVGEKIVLALATHATIESTTGTIVFDEEGRHHRRQRRESGSRVEAWFKMTREDYKDIIDGIDRIIVPSHITLTLNGEAIVPRTPIHTFEATLPTELADEEGNLRKTKRKTMIEVYHPIKGETGTIYELGIPVVELGDKWHYNICQKVPLNINRDNVTPAYRREVRKLVLNEMADRLDKEDADESWVTEGAGVEGITKAALETVTKLQFGEKYAAFDPTDPEAAEVAQTEGYTIISARGMDKNQRARLKDFGLIDSVSRIGNGRFATPKPFSDDPNAPPAEFLDQSEWTPGMHQFAEYAKMVAWIVAGKRIRVSIVKDMGTFAAMVDRHEMVINLKQAKKKWFGSPNRTECNKIIIHELAHIYSSSHVHEDFRNALEKLWSKLTEAVQEDPVMFARYRVLPK